MKLSACRRQRLAMCVAVGLMGGVGAPALMAQSLVVSDGQAHTASGSYATSGDAEHALAATNPGTTISGSPTDVVTAGNNAFAASASSGGAIDLDGARLATSGIGSHAAFVNDGSLTLDNADISTTGSAAYGLHSTTGPGGRLTVRDSTVTASGSGGHASVATAGRIDLVRSTIVSTQANALQASNAGTVVTGADTDFRSDATHVIRMASGASLWLTGGSVTAASATGRGLDVAGAGTTASVTDVAITTRGGSAIVADAGAAVTLDNANVQATEGIGVGISASGTDTQVTASGSTISSVGAQGVSLADGASASFTNTNITGTTGVALDAPTPATGSTLSFSGGSVQSTDVGILVNSGSHALTLGNGAQVHTSAGNLIEVGENANLDAMLDGVDLVGSIGAAALGGLDVTFRNNASLTGGIFNGRAIDVGATTTWTIDTDSDVDTLVHAGTIAFSELPEGTTSPGAFRFLTVHGDYKGDGGLLHLNASLEGDGAPSDILHVEGDTSGYTRVSIHNVGGSGALSDADGIRVVQVDGVSGGNFELEGRVVAGAFDYTLHKGGVIDPTDGDWYLRSEATPEPEDPDNGGGSGSGGDGGPVYRPEVAAYLANQMASMTMFRHQFNDRVSDGAVGEDVEPRNVWMRARQHHVDAHVAGQVSSGTDMRDVEVGAELVRWLLDDKHDVHLSLGAIYNQGRADSFEFSHVTGYGADGRLDARSFTLFGTWYNKPGARTGWYVDNWIQHTTFDQRVQGQDLAPELSSSKRWTASIEGGYGFLLHQADRFDLVLQPQLQVLYSDFDAPEHVESNGTVIARTYPGGWSARGGMRLSANVDRVLQPWFELNLWHDQRNPTMTFDGTPVELQQSDLVREINAGLSVGTGNGWSGWGSLGVQHGDGLRAAQGQLGVRYRW